MNGGIFYMRRNIFKRMGAVAMAVAMTVMMVPGIVSAENTTYETSEGDHALIEKINITVNKPVAGEKIVTPDNIEVSNKFYISFTGDAQVPGSQGDFGALGWRNTENEKVTGNFEGGKEYKLYFLLNNLSEAKIGYAETYVYVNGIKAQTVDGSADSANPKYILYNIGWTLGDGDSTEPYESNVSEEAFIDEGMSRAFLDSERPAQLNVTTGGTTEIGRVLFDLDATKAIFGNGGDIKFTMKVNSEPTGDMSGYDIVVDLSMTKNNENLFTEGNGTATITVPYEKEVPEGKTVKVFYITDSGKEAIDATYDKDAKTVSFTVTHFSTYAIQQVATESESPKTGQTTNMALVLFGMSIMGLAGAGFYAKKKEFFK